MGKFKVGQEVTYLGEKFIIVQKIKGSSTGRYKGWMGCGGIYSRPCTYLLSNGSRVRGSTLVKNGSKAITT